MIATLQETKAAIRRRVQRSDSYETPYETPTATPQERASLALSLGYRSLYESNSVSKVLPTALVGTVLMLHRERGLRMDELVDRVAWLQEKVFPAPKPSCGITKGWGMLCCVKAENRGPTSAGMGRWWRVEGASVMILGQASRPVSPLWSIGSSAAARGGGSW